MQQNLPGIPLLLEYFSSELNKHLAPFQIDEKNNLLLAIDKYINNILPYDQLLQIFIQSNISSNITNKLMQVKKVIDNPYQINLNKSITNPHNNTIIKKESWSEAEDIRLLAGISRFGLGNWSDISKIVGNDRTPAQCSQRWRRGLDPRISKGCWSYEEDVLLFKYVQQYGDKSWSKISSLIIGSRSDSQCKYRFLQINKQFQNNVLLYDIDRSNIFFSNNLNQIQHNISFNMSNSLDDNFRCASDQQMHCNHFPIPMLNPTETKAYDMIDTLRRENSELKKQNMILNMNKCSIQKKFNNFKKVPIW